MSDSKEESVGDLSGSAPVDRVVLQDEVKLFRVRAVLTYLDGPVYDLPGKVSFGQSPVPVYSDDMVRLLGFATVVLDRDGVAPRLVADLSLDYACEERLLVETQSAGLFARVFGSLTCAPMPLFDFQAPILAISLRIDGIQLTMTPPVDPRLEPLGKHPVL